MSQRSLSFFEHFSQSACPVSLAAASFVAPIVTSSRICFVTEREADGCMREKTSRLFESLSCQPQCRICNASISVLPLLDFVICRSSSVAQLLRTPFSESAWEFMACRFRGAVHLQEMMTQKWREDRYRQMMDSREDRTTYWGMKFPQYMASFEPGTTPDVQAVLNEMEEYKVVVRNCFGSHALVMSATMKAVDPRYEPGSTQGYVVFRTNQVLSTHRQHIRFGNKLLEWWSVSVPIGVPRILAGFRNKGGIVQSVEEFQVHEIPAKAKGMWSDDVCLGFLDQFLCFLKDQVREDDGKTVYHFEYQPHLRKVICTRLPGTDECAILPSWYLQAHDRKELYSTRTQDEPLL
ncbi:hypothetical protein HPB51_027204 [Rhipicephalus microplus]|uniref:Decapping nuclease n=1 Tax=Rhipicephalus microplus TaxID=6941 RepID=A0A9J6D0J6_RHIMP|nr:hypothetical protein HPB51_027204 [Rhipicephalus microplus]